MGKITGGEPPQAINSRTKTREPKATEVKANIRYSTTIKQKMRCKIEHLQATQQG